MKLLRIGEIGSEKPALIDNENKYRDLSSEDSLLSLYRIILAAPEIARGGRPRHRMVWMEPREGFFCLAGLTESN